MSQENVEAFKRAIQAYNGRNVEALLDELDTEVAWRPVLPVVLGGDETVYRGHDGVRQLLRDLDEVLAERHLDFPEIRDVGDRVVATRQPPHSRQEQRSAQPVALRLRGGVQERQGHSRADLPGPQRGARPLGLSE